MVNHHIGSYAFSNCEKLQTIIIQDNFWLQAIDEYAFANSSTNNIVIPSSLSVIDDYAFSSCYKLTKVEIPENSNLEF